MNWQAGSSLRLPEATTEIIASLGEHRILSTAQVRAIHYPDRSPRRTQQALSYLERAGLVAHVDTRRTPRRVWFLTDAGADAVILVGDTRERPKVLTPKQAAGPLTAHTLGVNEVGISFLRAARERGDEFLPLSWRHEVAHPLNRGRGRARRALIADAVFTYVRPEDRQIAIYHRFVEVDRATLSAERLVAELARYGQLYRAREKQGGEPLWSYYYQSFPAVICALTGGSREALNRRLDVALWLLGKHPSLDRAYDVSIYFCFLDDLKDRGPFAPIFYKLGEPDRAVDWTGEVGALEGRR
ncbi:MAG TPA: replication-relaxation family protein [Solirubrobacterales bacterium]|nr:replication-relaxation family protein [Solirubrobacterales bacterium]